MAKKKTGLDILNDITEKTRKKKIFDGIRPDIAILDDAMEIPIAAKEIQAGEDFNRKKMLHIGTPMGEDKYMKAMMEELVKTGTVFQQVGHAAENPFGDKVMMKDEILNNPEEATKEALEKILRQKRQKDLDPTRLHRDDAMDAWFKTVGAPRNRFPENQMEDVPNRPGYKRMKPVMPQEEPAFPTLDQTRRVNQVGIKRVKFGDIPRDTGPGDPLTTPPRLGDPWGRLDNAPIAPDWGRDDTTVKPVFTQEYMQEREDWAKADTANMQDKFSFNDMIGAVLDEPLWSELKAEALKLDIEPQQLILWLVEEYFRPTEGE